LRDNPRDTNPAQGFQGKLRIGYWVGSVDGTLDLEILPGCSYRGVPAVQGFIHSQADALTNAKIREEARTIALQQRLNYLGFPDEKGQPLVIDGIVGPHTEAALRLFKAAVDSSGTSSPQAENATLDDRTVRWLNAPNAPRWEKFLVAVETGLQEWFGTSWLVDSLAAANQTVPGAIVNRLAPEHEAEPPESFAAMFSDGLDARVQLPNDQLGWLKAFYAEASTRAIVQRLFLADAT
jgi:peptidoglycan hydrolase-like protein with peptidoglycan-binding domain